jgi:hypothetical protein
MRRNRAKTPAITQTVTISTQAVLFFDAPETLK